MTDAGTESTIILHVDDNAANRYAVTRTLKHAGFEVVEAVDGRDALAKLDPKIDLAIVDVRLPDVDGYEVCRRIKANLATASVPVLHLSANLISGDDRAFGLEGGADGYLVRPVTPRELIATVNALLRTRRSEQALRRSEARNRKLIQATSAVAWTTDAAGALVEHNESWGEHFGQSPSERQGFGWVDIVHPDDRDDVLGWWTAARRVSAPTEHSHRFKRADGQYRWYCVRAVPLDDAAGGIEGWIGTCTDIDDRHQAEMKLRDAKAEADTANRLKDEFLATLSHELRTPLNAIVGWTQILSEGESSPEELKEGIATIQRNARAQSQLIDDLLDVSRIISGKLRLEEVPVDMKAVTAAAVESVRPMAVAKRVGLRCDVPVAQAIVRGDGVRLQQVVWNLLTNAIKFTPAGGEVVAVVGLDAGQVRLTITDTGQGIDAAFLPFVFDRFRQAEASTKRSQGGLGLGLAIVRQLVDLHGGSVGVTSGGKGKGSTFEVRLPASVVVAEKVMPVESKAAGDGLRGKAVLVVEDDPDSLQVIARILRLAGCVVTTAASVADARGWMAVNRFDAVVSDIGMPGEDGYELIRWLRSRPADGGRDVCAVALTAFAHADDRARALAAGFNAHLSKPLDRDNLIATLSQWLAS